MLTCEFCGLTEAKDSDYFQLDKNRGFWCEDCDAYNFLEREDGRVDRKFTLILEEKSHKETACASPSIKLSKRISPYRYPGGKSRLVDYLYTHLQKEKTKKLVSPFSGGGSFELAMLESGVVEEIHLNDLDVGVYSFWWMVKHMPYELIDRIRMAELTHLDYFEAQSVIRSDYRHTTMVEAAWASLIVNRLAYSGISKAGPMGGKNGSSEKLLARWNAEELIRRIEKIHSLSDRIEITQENAVELIQEAYWHNDSTIFIDPPYVEKGKALYHCFYTEEDHRELAFTLDGLYRGHDGADIVLTYDNDEWLRGLYFYPEEEVIGRVYSV